MWKLLCLLSLLLISDTFISCVACQETDTCESDDVIQLPGGRKCLSYHHDSKHWQDAARICETSRGTLFRIEEGDLALGSAVGQCMLSTPDTGGKLDFWIGAVSQWSPQWYWVNGSFVNPLLACTRDYSTLTENSFDVCSDHLSIDYCVSVCRTEGAPFTVLEHRPGRLNPCCWCSYRFTGNQTCPFSRYRRQTSQWLNIFSSMPQLGTAIVLKSSEALVKTETLCALVNLDTTTIRELSSQSCFTQNYYLCSAGNETNCTLSLNGRCVYVGQAFVTWFAARADCRNRGGDLLIVADLVDMYEIIPYIKLKRNYWIGAYNHRWNFEPGSAVFTRSENYVESETTCGHMHNNGNAWRWSDTGCDSRKPFYCQYDNVKYADAPLDGNDDVICPWEINLPLPVLETTPRKPPIRGSTPDPPEEIVETRDTFPLAAVIAAAIAALLMLLCLLLTLFFIRRRRRKQNRLSKSDRVFGGHRLPKRFYQRWSNAYNYYPDHLSDGGWESLSSPQDGVLSDMSIVSAPSPGGYVREGFENQGLSRAYTLASPADLEALYATPKKSGIVRRSTTKGASHNFSTVAQAAGGEIAGTSGYTGSGGDYLDLDKTMTSIHQAGPPASKEYMTLAARMNIREDLGSARSATRNRPEVALVTDDVDLNFTVNHAVTKQRIASDHSSERTLDEIELPMGTTVEIPKYIPERVLY